MVVVAAGSRKFYGVSSDPVRSVGGGVRTVAYVGDGDFVGRLRDGTRADRRERNRRVYRGRGTIQRDFSGPQGEPAMVPWGRCDVTCHGAPGRAVGVRGEKGASGARVDARGVGRASVARSDRGNRPCVREGFVECKQGPVLRGAYEGRKGRGSGCVCRRRHPFKHCT